MKPLDYVILHELLAIEQIVRDETWLEGERRGSWVSSDDPVVRENVCKVILRIGAEMRASLAAGAIRFEPAPNAAVRIQEEHVCYARAS